MKVWMAWKGSLQRILLIISVGFGEEGGMGVVFFSSETWGMLRI